MKHETSDKTLIMYRLEEYHRVYQNTVTTYKKSNKEAERRITFERIKYAKEAKILDMVKVSSLIVLSPWKIIKWAFQTPLEFTQISTVWF